MCTLVIFIFQPVFVKLYDMYSAFRIMSAVDNTHYVYYNDNDDNNIAGENVPKTDIPMKLDYVKK